MTLSSRVKVLSNLMRLNLGTARELQIFLRVVLRLVLKDLQVSLTLTVSQFVFLESINTFGYLESLFKIINVVSSIAVHVALLKRLTLEWLILSERF